MIKRESGWFYMAMLAGILAGIAWDFAFHGMGLILALCSVNIGIEGLRHKD